jgi:hypothetical protein
MIWLLDSTPGSPRRSDAGKNAGAWGHLVRLRRTPALRGQPLACGGLSWMTEILSARAKVP